MGITISSLRRRLQQAHDLLLQIPWSKTPTTLPSDVIFDILSRVPAKSMCRFRCVSRECRDRISDPVFIAAAQERRPPEPLLVVGSDHDMSLRLVDMDGTVVRVISGMNRPWVPVSTNPDGFVCVTTGFSKDDNLAGVIDLTTMKMPVTHLKSDRAWGYGRAVPSGAYKMVRLGFHHCEVFTVGDNDGWKRRKCPPFRFDGSSHDNYTAAVNGMLHFLPVALPDEEGTLLFFDLESEEWKCGIKGPPKVKLGRLNIRLGELNGSLCMVEPEVRHSGYTNIWLLKDHHKSVWVKAYTIPLDTSAIDRRHMMPLRVLDDDGLQLLFYSREKGEPPELHIYDRRHGTYRNATKELLGHDHVSGIGFCSLRLESFLSAEFQCPVSSSYFS
ncbi:unnamed protein product [Triticum turgidum subsp. durum]|uniref:F-box domain-containing protein n=1 Tax=Triticum turgidum subsp. durum TaxID=4567 RepID=A0A9R1AC56_TRITD|nr:unnamed protein product [Triticum turgidum subsp. durum]